MAIRRRKSRHAHDDAKGRKKHVEELSGRLAPLEEQEEFAQSEQRDGDHGPDDTIRVDSSSVKTPGQFLDSDHDTRGTFYLEPVAIFIVVVMLAFIALVAWKVAYCEKKCEEKEDATAASHK